MKSSYNVLSRGASHEEHENLIPVLEECSKLVPEYNHRVNLHTREKIANRDSYYRIDFIKVTSLGRDVVMNETISKDSISDYPSFYKNRLKSHACEGFINMYSEYHFTYGDIFSIFGSTYSVTTEPGILHGYCSDCDSWCIKETDRYKMKGFIEANDIDKSMFEKIKLLAMLRKECNCKE